jgi:regulator of protease activity HflC (stomatin/prohibitin superfamily)
MSLIYTIPQSHCVVLERFGKFARIQQQGLQFRIPILERIRRLDATWGETANKRGFLIELTEQQTDTPPRQCHTKDNVPVIANASVYWRIIDPRKALYEVDILPSSVSDIALNALRSNIGTLELDAVLSERAQLNERIASQLSETAKKWGIIFTRIEIQEITTDQKVAESMVKQMDAERRRRAFVAEAEGQAEAKIKVAEAEKQALILRSEGEAIAKAKIAEAESFYLKRLKEQVGEAQAVQIVIAQKYLAGFETITKGSSDKVFLPNSFQGLFSISTEKNQS